MKGSKMNSHSNAKSLSYVQFRLLVMKTRLWIPIFDHFIQLIFVNIHVDQFLKIEKFKN